MLRLAGLGCVGGAVLVMALAVPVWAQAAPVSQPVTLDNLSEPLKWILGALTTVVLGGGGAFFAIVVRQIGQLTESQREAAAAHATALDELERTWESKLDERFERLMARLEAMRETTAADKIQLARIDERFAATDARYAELRLALAEARQEARAAHMRLDRQGAPAASGNKA